MPELIQYCNFINSNDFSKIMADLKNSENGIDIFNKYWEGIRFPIITKVDDLLLRIKSEYQADLK